MTAATIALRGPADADHFRVKVGRYGDRWYTDPLPTCPIAEASDWQGPAWSIVKGAAGKDWSFVTNKRNGHTSRAELERIATLEPDARTAAFNQIDKTGLNQAAGRGTIVHLWAEDLLAGRSPRDLNQFDLSLLHLPQAALEEAQMYRKALVAFFDAYQPEVVAVEYVALHRSLNGFGYGCTPDVVARIGGKVYGIDWKSRGLDSEHGAYPEEAAQIAAGAHAEYMIIQGPDGSPQRAPLPAIDGGIVVSIHPTGCRVYPVDLAPAWEHVQAMHAFWLARQVEKKPIGKPWAPIPVAPISVSGVSLGAPEAAGLEPSTGPAAVDAREVIRANPFLAANLSTLAHTIADWDTATKARLARLWPSTLATPRQVRDGHAVWGADDIPALQAVLLEAQAPWTGLDRTLDSNPKEDRWTTTSSPPASNNSTSSGSTSSTPSTGSTTQPNGFGTHPKTSPPPPGNSSNKFADTLDSFAELPPDDGGPLDPKALEALLADAVDVKMVINMWLVEATAAGCNWNPRKVGTVRSFEQARAARALASMWDDSPAGDAFVRLIVKHATGTHWETFVGVGVVIGRLTIGEALRVVDTVDAINAQRLTLRYADDGTPLLVSAT